MPRRPYAVPILPLIALLALSTTAARAQNGISLEFLERYALADDRQKALDLLIPGTEEHYFFRCRLLQDTGAFDQVPEVLGAWIQRHGRTAGVVEIENRQALLTFDRDPAATYAFLQQRLDLRFDHQRHVPGARPDLPTALDPAAIAPATLTARALAEHPGTVDGFHDRALRWLVQTELDDDRLMSLLGRLERPDVPGLPALVVRNLGHRQSRGFGSLGIHGRLLLDQLDECARLRPALRNEPAWVEVYLRRLRPGADVDWPNDAAARLAYLERLQAFAASLLPAHNSLKAHVLFHRLRHDLSQGTLDRGRLLEYLRLPRTGAVAHPLLAQRARAGQVVEGGREFPTGFERIGDDAAVVRACLMHFFRSDDTIDAFRELVPDDYLRRLLAETRILLGSGDMERWYSLLDDPACYEALRQRVEILFPPELPTHFGADQPVVLEVDVKHVPQLLVKVFEVNAFEVYRATGAEVDAGIDLDGLVANQESSHEYQENPLRRVRRRFELPALNQPGVYVVEFVGNGIASRVLVHKGRLQYRQRPGAAGHVFRVLDEAGNHLRDAAVWFGGRDYAADADGEIVVPYATEPGTKTIVLRHGRLATLERFQHLGEEYSLQAGIHVARETLLAGRRAPVLVRPQLLLAGRPLPLELLQEPVLDIVARDLDGVAAQVSVRDLELTEDRELVHQFLVPERLQSLAITLRGRVQDLDGKPRELTSATLELPLNGIAATPLTGCPLLLRTPAGYLLELRGKDGEPLGDRAVDLWLWHADFRGEITVNLKTDAEGRIRLGPLPGITALRASGFPERSQLWWLGPEQRTLPGQVHGRVGAVVRVPYPGTATVPDRAELGLLEVRDGSWVRDAFASLALADGFVELRGLAAGDYELWLGQAGHTVPVRITEGPARDGVAAGRGRLLELPDRPALQVLAAGYADGALTVRLRNATPATRVHVAVSRHLPPFSLRRDIGAAPADAPWAAAIRHGEVDYRAGREIGDEYRYILERRFARRFPGNMLPRPGLLLNPWALPGESWNDMIGLGGGAGGSFGGRGGGRRRSAAGAEGERRYADDPGAFADLGFLPEPGVLLANLRPGADGVLRVPAADLGSGPYLQILALDGADAVPAVVVRDAVPFQPRSQRLARTLDPAQHLAERRRVEFLAAGGKAVLEDVRTARAETYDSLTAVHRLFAALSGDPGLQQFAFLLRWPQLTPEEQRRLYGEHACHELHFFLFHKDPAFFAAVVRPYLACKVHQTFLDQWLLGEDLQAWLEPWAFRRLNVVERILLARRLPADAAAGVLRNVTDLCDLRPPDPAAEDRLFAGLLQGGALDPTRGLAGELAELRDKLAQAPEPQAPPAAAKAPAPAESKEESAFDSNQWNAAAGLGGGRKAGAPGAADEKAAAGKDVDRDAGAPARARARELARREQARTLYRGVDPTRRYAEQNYWRLPIEQQDGELIAAAAFWRDYALAAPDQPFCPPTVATATGNLTGMLLALAVLDLPFVAQEHQRDVDGARVALTAGSPLLLARRELVPAAPAADAAPLLLSQNYYRLDERYRHVGNERRDAWVRDEYLVGVAYGCQVVATNPTSSPRTLDLLLQIPAGALPVSGGFVTRSVSLALQANGTASVDYAFYFPVPGSRVHWSAHASERGELVAFAEARTLNVVAAATQIDTASWEHVSQNAGTPELLTFLQQANLQRLELERIAWRMADAAVFRQVLGLLRSRQAFHPLLWSYGIRHRDAVATREYLRAADGFLAGCGPALRSPLLTIDPVERRAWQLIEFAPLHNARAHPVGRRRVIESSELARHWRGLLEGLAARPRLQSGDWLLVTYYLLLQDRVGEALDAFARVDPAGTPAQLQYDYLRSYLAFFAPEPGAARSIAAQHAEHPVARWRDRFRAVLRQLDEAEGRIAAEGAGGRDQQQDAQAASEPSLELAVADRRVTLRYRNLERCELNLYAMDVEFRFSTQPFVQEDAGAFAWIRPNHQEQRPLPADRGEITFDLPAAFAASNVLVEARAGGITRRQAVYASALAVRLLEGIGQLEVGHAGTGRRLPGTYVKVYARLPDGAVVFHKDGYTDLRGRFDYASVSTQVTSAAERFAILVLSDSDGAVIREVAPPAR